MKAILSLWLLAAGVCCAAPLIDEPVAELRLKSGKVLTGAVAKSFTPTSVFVKHADGAASVKYEDFPAEYAAALTAKRPAPPTAEELAQREEQRKIAALRQAEENQRNAVDLQRRRQQAAEDAARRVKNAESDAIIEEQKTKYLKNDVWILGIQYGNGDTLFAEFVNDGDSSLRWELRDIVGLTRTGTTCNAIRVVSMNRAESLFETMTVPAKGRKKYHITFDRPDGTWPRDMIWKR